jgi:cyclic pyranopterin phosphate synthase
MAGVGRPGGECAGELLCGAAGWARFAGGRCDNGAAAVGFLNEWLKDEKLSHYDEAGQAHMVDVSAKAATRREAVAEAFVELSEAVLAALPSNPKGNPLEVARFAGIQAAKQTAALIPMCHPLALSFVDVQATVVAGGVAIEATAATVAGTGVEMEAMVAASVAALTVYDMTKALDKGIRIREVVLVRKSGGKSGDGWRAFWARPQASTRP